MYVFLKSHNILAQFCLFQKVMYLESWKEYVGFQGGTSGKESAYNAGDVRDTGSIPGSEDPLEEGMTTHSSILAWRIPWTEEPSGLQSTGLQRVRHNWSDLAQHMEYVAF